MLEYQVDKGSLSALKDIKMDARTSNGGRNIEWMQEFWRLQGHCVDAGILQAAGTVSGCRNIGGSRDMEWMQEYWVAGILKGCRNIEWHAYWVDSRTLTGSKKLSYVRCFYIVVKCYGWRINKYSILFYSNIMWMQEHDVDSGIEWMQEHWLDALSECRNIEWMQKHWVDAEHWVEAEHWVYALKGCRNIEWMQEHWVDAGTLSGCRNIEWMQEQWVDAGIESGCRNSEWMQE